MRTLSASLLAAQVKDSRTPYLRVEAANRISGVVRLDWERLYTGSEPDGHHAAALAGDGSLLRVRVTPPADAGKLYRQRVAAPGPGADFSAWVYTGQYDVVAVACASLGAEVSIFWVRGDRTVYQLQSTDYGATWGSPQIVGYSPAPASGLAAAYKPGGDVAVFLADSLSLYIFRRTGGAWADRVAWDKATGELSGVAAAYDGDWALLVAGRDTAGSFKVWSLAYGDGGEVAVGTWSPLREMASAPADGSFAYRAPFLAKTDEVYRALFVEVFSGTEATSRVYRSHTLPGGSFAAGLWLEPVPCDLSGEYGAAIAGGGDRGWLSTPSGVWRSGALTPVSLDLTPDVLSLRAELGEGQGRLTVELRNDDGRYAAPGEEDLAWLSPGAEITLSPGYRTPAGNEVSPGPTFVLEAGEHTSSSGRASLVLTAYDGWGLVKGWEARHQFRWNRAGAEASVRDILAFVLGRMGLALEEVSASSVIGSFYPDFTVSPGQRGDTVVARLLSFVPDVLFIEGCRAYLVNQLASDSPGYSYGGEHVILEGRYQRAGWDLNRVQVEGRDPATGSPIVVDVFSWEEIARYPDRGQAVFDRNLDTEARARERGEAVLRKAEMESEGGEIRVPPNCGQQLYDIIAITDSRAGLAAAKRRVRGITLLYEPRRGIYQQKLLLGGV